MTLENLVTSRDLSEKLAKAGVEGPSVHWWVHCADDKWRVSNITAASPGVRCFTTDELLEKLPESVPIPSDKKNPDGSLRWPDGFPVELTLFKNENDYTACYDGEHPVTADRPVEALGMLLLKLVEEGAVKP